VKGNRQSSNNPSVRRQKKDKEEGKQKCNNDPKERKGNWMQEVGSECSDDPDMCQIEHGCDRGWQVAGRRLWGKAGRGGALCPALYLLIFFL